MKKKETDYFRMVSKEKQLCLFWCVSDIKKIYCYIHLYKRMYMYLYVYVCVYMYALIFLPSWSPKVKFKKLKEKKTQENMVIKSLYG